MARLAAVFVIFFFTFLISEITCDTRSNIWDGPCGIPTLSRIQLASHTSPGHDPANPYLIAQILSFHSTRGPHAEDIALSNPWLISIREKSGGISTQVAAATLIRVKQGHDASDIAITSGYKCEKLQKGSYFAAFGAYSKLDEGVFSVRIDTCYPHKAKNHWSGSNDIGIVRLSTPVNFTKVIRPACLPDMNEANEVATRAILPSWNVTSHHLQLVQLEITDRQRCRLVDNTEDTFCIGPYGSNSAAYCGSDCGGPVLKDGEGKATIIGVPTLTSRGLSNPSLPTVAASVAYYIRNGWLEDMIKAVSVLWKEGESSGS